MATIKTFSLFSLSFVVILFFFYLRSEIDTEKDPRTEYSIKYLRANRKENFQAGRFRSVKSKVVEDDHSKLLRLGKVRPSMVSWSPKVMILDNFLSFEECDHLVMLAKGKLEPSTVVDEETGKSVSDDWRNSSNYFLSDEEETEDKIVVNIIKRISIYTQTPEKHMEPFQILRYKNGQYYKEHEDFIDGPAIKDSGSLRTKTVLLYLTDGVVGGETWFLNATGNCTCGGKTENGLSVQPEKGRAVVFWDMNWKGKADPLALHAGCVVLSGEKWSATKWLLNGPFYLEGEVPEIKEGEQKESTETEEDLEIEDNDPL